MSKGGMILSSQHDNFVCIHKGLSQIESIRHPTAIIIHCHIYFDYPMYKFIPQVVRLYNYNLYHHMNHKHHQHTKLATGLRLYQCLVRMITSFFCFQTGLALLNLLYCLTKPRSPSILCMTLYTDHSCNF